MQSDQNKVFVEHSITYKPYYWILAVVLVMLFPYVIWTTSEGMERHVIPWVDGAIQLVILYYLIDIATMRIEYFLEDTELVMVKHHLLWKKQVLRIPYDDIFGVHHFKNQLMKPVTYRYTFHMYSKMDNRPIWSLLYKYKDSTKKVGRVLMKGSEDFWHALDDKAPDRICIPQEEVLAYAFAHMGRVVIDKHGGEAPSFEEGIRQLRQEGTEMGGKEYELTKENFTKKKNKASDTDSKGE